jgi:hypothetical protein
MAQMMQIYAAGGMNKTCVNLSNLRYLRAKTTNLRRAT